MNKKEIEKSVKPDTNNDKKRAAMNAVAGAIPFVGGVLSAGAAYWSEQEQKQINDVLQQWIQMLEDELREKEKTIAEVVARLDMSEDETKERVESPEYQSLLKKAFRNWSSVDTEYKRERVRNILANAAAGQTTSDDVVRLFLDWIDLYSDFHFQVIAKIYDNPGVTRGGIWHGLNKPPVREDSAEADLFKLLIRDLSMGSVIRQHRPTDYHGNYLKKAPSKTRRGQGSSTMKSAFDTSEPYELTDLGKQFVHYAMNEITAKIEFHEEDLNGSVE